jgi:hypothetical protein
MNFKASALKPQQIIFEIDYFKYGAAAKMYPLRLVPVELGTGDVMLIV